MARTYPSTITANSLASSADFNDEIVLNLQHLLAYMIDGVNLNTITTPVEIHNFTERVAPSTPSSNVMSLYLDSADGLLKTKADNGYVSQIGQQRWTYDIPLSSGQFDVTLTDYDEFDGCKTIEIEVGLRSSVSATTDTAYLLFNSDTTVTNYKRQAGGGNDAAAITGYTNAPSIALAPGATAPASAFLTGIITIRGMDKTILRTAEFVGGTAYDTTKGRIEVGFMWWNVTTAITRFRLRPDLYATDTWHADSWMRLHFIK